MQPKSRNVTAQLVLVHGSGYTPDSFTAQVAGFVGSRALALPGHPVGEALTSVKACADWLARRLQLVPDNATVVVGNSLGGAIALRWALDFPAQARGLVLIGTGARLRVAPAIFAMIDNEWAACIPTLVDLALSAHAPANLRVQAIRWHEQVGQENTRRDYAACDAFDVMTELAKLQLPTLIIVGSDDRLTPLKYSQYLQAHISASELVVIEGAGHLAMAEQPDRVNAAIQKFLDSM